jgi:transcription-repair coupling factor (superfamily II helicase)
MRKDTEIVFGSDDSRGFQNSSTDEEEDFLREKEERKAIVDKVLEEQDNEFKEERRRKKWGDFAEAKTKEDIVKVEQSIKAKIAKENEKKSILAQEQGVVFEVLEAQETVSDDNGNIQIKSGSSELWYNKVDEDLQEEWERLESGNDELKSADGEEESTDTMEVNGKIVSKDTMNGVRVGSAGGWSLEVFPGDFVVHRKYGIGRFEKTMLRPRSKLSKEQMEAREARRAEILTEELKKISGGVTPDEIQSIRGKFGTDEDLDPISNPQTSCLEIVYSDGIVHVRK